MNDQTQPPFFPFHTSEGKTFVGAVPHSQGGPLPATFPPAYEPAVFPEAPAMSEPYRPTYVAPPDEHAPATWPTQDVPQRVQNANLRYMEGVGGIQRGPVKSLKGEGAEAEAAEAEKFASKRGRKRGDNLSQRWSPIRQRLAGMNVGDCEAFFVEEQGQDIAVTQACHERWAKNAGMDFVTARGVFVRGFGNTNDTILVTRTA